MTAAWLRPRMWFAQLLGVALWCVWLGSLASGGWQRDHAGQLFAADHIAFYTAAQLIDHGHGAHIYDFAQVQEYQQQLTGGTWPHVMGYRNPPFYTLLYIPTSRLPLFTSALIWTVISLGAIALAVWLVGGRWRALAWAFTFYPLFAAVSFGQNTPLSMAVFAGVYRLLRSERQFAAGLVAGLLWYKPQLLIGVLVWWGLMPRTHLRCWFGLAVTGAVLAAVSWLAVPEASWAFVDSLTANAAYGGHGRWNEHSPRAFWELLLPGVPALTWPLTLACSLAGVAAAWRLVHRTVSPLDVMFPVAVFLALWASPHVLVYEWALLIPAAVVLWERFPDRRDTWLPLFALAWTVLAVSTPLAKWQIDRLPVAVQLSIPVMAFVGWRAARALTSAPRTVVIVRTNGDAT
ncbi:MAG TPA: glycosyltransferase family 87 protein [Gemmataceae bacterium]|nr:glycosyltransferase family 87 protein [Gemmataceae bacterium]